MSGPAIFLLRLSEISVTERNDLWRGSVVRIPLGVAGVHAVSEDDVRDTYWSSQPRPHASTELADPLRSPEDPPGGIEPGSRGDQDAAAEEVDTAPSADARPQERNHDARPPAARPASCWAWIT
jgi:hypothetical protein